MKTIFNPKRLLRFTRLRLGQLVRYWRFKTAPGAMQHDQGPALPGLGNLRFAIGLTAITQILGLVITAGSVWWQSAALDRLGKSHFDQGVERTEAEVLRRFNQSTYGLKGARGAIAANPQFRRQAFRAYVASRDLPSEFPGIRGFGFVEPVRRAQLAAYVARQRADGAPDFAVQTGGAAAELFVVSYVEPLTGNHAARGFDLAQEKVRREAIEIAIATGEPTLSGRVELKQDALHSPGLVYFLPVYRAGTHPQTPQQRRRDLFGLLYIPIVASELLGTVNTVTDGLIDFELFDGPRADASQRIFGTRSVAAASAFVAEKELSIGRHVLSLRAGSSPRFEQTQDRSSLLLIGVGGTLVSVLAAISVWLLSAGRQRAQDLAESMTRELNRMAQVVQHTDNAVTIADRDMRIQWVNQGFSRITGYSMEEARGKTAGELLASGKSAPQAMQALADCARLGTACRVEVINRARDGREYWADTEVQPTFDAQGVLVGFMEIGTDITQQKQTERILQEAREKAELATRSKGQFLANMSHEIRTPMNAILGMLKLLRNTELSGRQRDYADKTEGAAKSLLSLVNDILDFSKVEAGKMTLDPQPFRLDRLMRELGVILSSNLGAKAIEVLFEIDPALPPMLRGDSLRLQQVLINLGGNAIKFTAQGQVVIALRLLRLQGEMATVEFAVQDSGIGIAPENQAHIFTSFSQAESSTTRRFGGTGLGLSISERLVALMGGELRLHSVLGAGSTFSFTLQLPVVEALPGESEPEPAGGAGRHRLGGMRILVVEDNPTNQQVAQELLMAEGALVSLAANGRLGVDAIAAAATGLQFDAVLMDLQMPVLDGLAATRLVRNTLQLRTLPIIAMTANAMASDRAECLAAGMNEHVGKPFDLNHLVQMLLRVSGFTAVRDAALAAEPAAPPVAAVPLPQGEIDYGAALARMGGQVAPYTRAIQNFLQHLPADLAELRSALARDAGHAIRLAHTLKGTAAVLGAAPLSQAAAHLEQLCAGGAAAPLRNVALQALEATAAVTELQLQQALPALGAAFAKQRADPAAAHPGAGAEQRAALLASLKQLMGLLAADDLSALELFASLHAEMAMLPVALLEPLELALQDLDLDQALCSCEVIAVWLGAA